MSAVLGLKSGDIIEGLPLMTKVCPESMVVQVLGTTEEDSEVSVSYFGVPMGKAYVTKDKGTNEEHWEWV